MVSVSGDASVREGEVRESMRARVRVTVGAGGGSVFGSIEAARVGVGVRIRVETHPRKIIL